MIDRELARLARLDADQQTRQADDWPTTDFLGVVDSWNATTQKLTVRWRGTASLPALRHASYSPAVNDRVHCALVDNQIVVLDHIV